MKLVHKITLLVLLLVLAVSPGAPALNVVDTVLQDVWDSTGQTIRISYVSSESGWDVAEETALTNTVHPLVTFTHTTSGTPANGIGLSLDWYQETAAANTELGARIVVKASDVTATSEDFQLDWMLMTAGATPATKMSLSSVGVLTLVNGATLDNSTNGTLTITEPAISIAGTLATTGAVDFGGTITLENDETIGNSVDGTIAITGAVTISGDLDIDTDVLSVDTTNDIVEVNGFLDSPYLEVTAASYTLAAASKANYVVVNYTDTGAVGITLASDWFVDGRWVTIKDGELNAGSNNIVIGTEGSETIDEAATYTMNANGESVTLLCDGTNALIMSAYGE